MKALRLHVLVVVAAAIGLLLLPSVANAATFAVTKTADTNDGTCGADCSLREAIVAANAAGGADTITVPAGIYTLTIAGTNENAAATGDLDVTGNVTINGAGAGTTIVDANALDRVFHVVGVITVGMSGLTIRNGSAPSGGGIFVGGASLDPGTLTLTNTTVSGNSPGGIINLGGTLTLNSSTISGNTAGSGIANSVQGFLGGRVTLNSSTVSGNSSVFNGGGIFNFTGSTGMLNDSTVTLNDSTISGNTATGSGGGIDSNAVLTLNDSTVSGNSSGTTGGGINNSGAIATATLSGSTISGNSAGAGGGIWNSGSLALTNGSTISGNTALGSGGGIINFGATATAALSSSNVSSNTSGSNGGGIHNSGAGATATLTSSTVSGNAATDGGGIDIPFSATATLNSSTVSGNAASNQGGGINVNGAVTLNSSTVSGNTSFQAGGINGSGGGGTVTLKNSTLSGNTGSNSGGNCGGLMALISNGYNLSSDATCAIASAGDKQNTNPLLGPLAFNGGPTPTHALLEGSPAADAGSPICPPTDQRGVSRPQGLRCDIGAYEAPDTDADGVADPVDSDDDNDLLLDSAESPGCRLQAEDYDGFQDTDGCPEPDNDGDSVCDAGQLSVSCAGSDSGKYCFDPAATISCPTTDCRNAAEDIDAFKDQDGCPEPDNDNDGKLDAADVCPGTNAHAGADGMLGSGEDLNHNGLLGAGEDTVVVDGILTTDDGVRTYEDYDGVIDNDGCHDSPSDDFDGDSRGVLSDGLPLFRDEREVFTLGTDPVLACAATPTADDEPAPDAWPPDFNDTQGVSITDVLFFKGQLNTANGRFDFDGSGGVGITDVLFMKFYFNQTCAP